MIRQGTIVLTEEEGNLLVERDGKKRIDHSLPTFQELGVKPGWKRISASYKVSPDGLRMDYKVEDVEIVNG